MMSLAALALARRGITGQSLANDLGLTRAAVSFQLTGKAAKTSPALLDAIAARGGEELAQTVDRLIEEERRRRRIVRTAAEVQRLTSQLLGEERR